MDQADRDDEVDRIVEQPVRRTGFPKAAPGDRWLRPIGIGLLQLAVADAALPAVLWRKPQSVKSGAAAMPSSAFTRSLRRIAAWSASQPPIDDPASISGPSVSRSIAASTSSSQRVSVPSAKSPPRRAGPRIVEAQAADPARRAKGVDRLGLGALHVGRIAGQEQQRRRTLPWARGSDRRCAGRRRDRNKRGRSV